MTLREIITGSSICLLLMNGTCQRASVHLETGQIPLATPQQTAAWERTNNFLLGIRGNDPVAGEPEINRQRDWTMVGRKKQNLGAILNRFGTYPENNGQIDWNFMVRPVEPFMELYDLAVDRSSPGQRARWHRCINPADQASDCSENSYNNDPCMWVEISPYRALARENAWFPLTNDRCQEGSYLSRNDTLGVYGYPVLDDEHGNNPEIHPAQQLWFRNRSKSTAQSNFYWLLFIQDASQRFEDWIGSPIFGQFLVAFRIKPFNLGSHEPYTMNVGVKYQEDLITNRYLEHAIDADSGTSHELILNGTHLLTVNELGGREANYDLGVTFQEITRLEDGTLQGYVQISQVLGDYDTDPIGVSILELEVIPPKEIIPPIK